MSNNLCKIQLLGGLRIQIGEREITRFSTQKTAVLLAYLAYYRHQSHPREVLIEMLWPECEPQAGRNRLSVALTMLRRQFEPPGVSPGTIIQADRFAVSLNPAAATTDVAEFLTTLRKAARATNPTEQHQHLQYALSLYQGELLPGFYEDWVLVEQRRLAEMQGQVARFLARHSESTAKVESFSLPILEPLSTLPNERALADCYGRLPPSFTRFFGREDELVRLSELLHPDAAPLRLLTLTGPGGAGKTRLAIMTAQRLWDAYPGNLWYVALADITDVRHLPAAIAEALELLHTDNIEPMEQVATFLNTRHAPTLLVLDNFEQLVEEGAEIVHTLLERASGLCCLITSRRLLGLAHEREFPVPPLPTPRGADTPERLSLYDSIRLFVDRAQAVMPHFQVTTHNAPAIAELCDRLEGIPLALELAAARASVLTPAQMLDQLEHRFDFLVSKKRDRPERHKTLRAALDWSYHLLSPEAQRFFARLSVFRGGWTLEAASAVCVEKMEEKDSTHSPQSLVLELLEHLRECSLVLSEETEQGMRFRMLEMLREYAQERLQEASEEPTVHERHAIYFLALAEEALPHLNGSEQVDWFERLEKEYPNFRSALEWFQKQPTGGEGGLRLCTALAPLWHIRGHHEGNDLMKASLSHSAAQARTRARARALNAASLITDVVARKRLLEDALSIWQETDDRNEMAISYNRLGVTSAQEGDLTQARVYFLKALSLNRELGITSEETSNLMNLGTVASYLEDYEQAAAFLEEGLSASRARKDSYSIALALTNLGSVKENLKDVARARSCYEEALALHRTLKHEDGIAHLLNNLAKLAFEQGDPSEARRRLIECLSLSQKENLLHHTARALDILAELTLTEAIPERAARLSGAAFAILETLSPATLPDTRTRLASKRIKLREILTPEGFEREWAAGCAMTWEQAVAYALKEMNA